VADRRRPYSFALKLQGRIARRNMPRRTFSMNHRAPSSHRTGPRGSAMALATMVWVLSLAGCAASTPLGSVDPSHPASAEALEASVTEPATMLRDEVVTAETSDERQAPERGHGHHHSH
jgi:hypothetical protein